MSHYLCKEVDLFPICFYAISQRKRKRRITGDSGLRKTDQGTLIISQVCMYGCVYVFMTFLTETVSPKFFGSNPEIMINIVNLRINVIFP